MRLLLSLSMVLFAACLPTISGADAGAGGGGSTAGGAGGGSTEDAGGGSGGGEAEDAGPGDAGETPHRFELIEQRTLPIGSAMTTVELIRVLRPDGAKSFLLYVHALDPTQKPAVVVATQPYDGIDWTGEAVDQKWAMRGPGVHPDDDAPAYNGTDQTTYTPVSVQDQLNGDAVFLLNGFAVVHTYGRFYAGGTVEDDIRDAAAGYHFIVSRPTELDVTRVGSVGGSWGGLMALFGAARAPAVIGLKALAPLTPPSDLAEIWDWGKNRAPMLYANPAPVNSFFHPYLRRIEAATSVDGGITTPTSAPMAWAPYRQPAVCAALRANHPEVKVIAGHDEWDTLVPVVETVDWVKACPELVNGLYWPRNGPPPYTALDHGPFATEPGLPSMYTFSYLHLALALTKDDQTALTAGAPAAIDAYLQLLKDAKARGVDVSFALPALRSVCHPRARVFNLVTGTYDLGASMISGSLNRVFSVATTPETVCATLQTGLP